ncbi:sirohydrochlorin cobaltochelatase [Pyramidobacter sp. YE332]|uniref:sirohydrochlorin cobaltochelatase n=1 Tax=Pyramidobacter sp. YE332 TaxID=3068894 RepID=UPI00294B5F3B|nr:sirohydrochlorin cobaltochelatase [Pyramidobacter sp. YE332]WOL39561.1 sirohydrochlorin cobaltochelatase [Pyramidobacter sp. YE332]
MNMSFKSMILAVTLVAVAFSGIACAKEAKKEEKQAILITSFGTSMPSARKAIDNLVVAAKKAFPGAEVRLAFTSNIIRRKLAREGKKNVPPRPSWLWRS